MPQPNDLSRSLVALDQDSTLIAVIEMSQSSWLVAGIVPGIERQPLKKLEPSRNGCSALLHRWRDEAVKAGRTITRIAVAFEAGRDGFWLARWLRARGIEAHVIHPTSVAVSREHRRAKTDRLDTELLKRAFLGWLRGERGHCSMAAIPTHGGGGRQAAEPRAREPGRRAHPHRQPDEGHAGAPRHPRLQADACARRQRASRNPAHAGGRAAAAEHAGRAAARHGAAGLRREPDQGDRGSALGTARQAARGRAARDGAPAGARCRRWHRDGGHAGA